MKDTADAWLVGDFGGPILATLSMLTDFYGDAAKKCFLKKNLNGRLEKTEIFNSPNDLHLIFAILQFEISSFMNWIFSLFQT